MARAYFLTGEVEKDERRERRRWELVPADVKPRLEAWLKDLEAEGSKGK